MYWKIPARNSPVVLVVDDEDAVRRYVGHVLEGAGYRVLEACSSVDALQLAAEHRGPIDLLLTDYDMKIFHHGTDLATCFAMLRPETKVLVSSASSLPEGARPEGCWWEFLPKPFSPWEITERVGSMLAKHPEYLTPA